MSEQSQPVSYPTINLPVGDAAILAEFIEHYAPLDYESERLLGLARVLRAMSADEAPDA